MNTEYLLAAMGIVMIISIAIIYICKLEYETRKERIKVESKQNTEEPKSKNKITSDSVILHLDWLLANSIITSKEYNQLMLKCSSYF